MKKCNFFENGCTISHSHIKRKKIPLSLDHWPFDIIRLLNFSQSSHISTWYFLKQDKIGIQPTAQVENIQFAKF